MLRFKAYCDYSNKPAIYLIRKKHQIPGELRGDKFWDKLGFW